MATNGAFPFRFRFVSGAFPESGEIGKHGPGKFEQEPLAKAFGKNKFIKDRDYLDKKYKSWFVFREKPIHVFWKK